MSFVFDRLVSVWVARDVEENAIVLRVPWGDLGWGASTRFLVAVGSNASWNDDLPDSGGFVVDR